MYLENGFARKATKVFQDKKKLYRCVLGSLIPQFEWDPSLKMTPYRAPAANRSGCISKRFKRNQIKKAKEIVLSAQSLEELLARLVKEVEVL
jgi:hypothetical protein